MRFPVSLRCSLYVAPKPRPPPLRGRGRAQTQNCRFGVKSHFAWRKSATKFFMWKLSASKL